MGKHKSTKRYMPWYLVYYETYISERLSRLREKRLKHNGNALRELKKRIGILDYKYKGKSGEDLSSTTLGGKKSGAGFTLVEALAVVAIIGFLASIVMIRVGTAKKQGKDTAVVAGLKETRNAAEMYFNQLYTYEGVCDAANTTLSDQGDFGRIKAYIEQHNGEAGVIGCKDADEGFAVISSLNLGDCWCIDYQGLSKKVILGAGEECDDKLTTITCP
ncbi:hypothetical protein AMJ47_01695 [Parcubacteria bacterium DG_72]|nr:MAG: hypothetical protein AMJ47_01695 [Parcubacteria bacterium DG_72]